MSHSWPSSSGLASQVQYWPILLISHFFTPHSPFSMLPLSYLNLEMMLASVSTWRWILSLLILTFLASCPTACLSPILLWRIAHQNLHYQLFPSPQMFRISRFGFSFSISAFIIGLQFQYVLALVLLVFHRMCCSLQNWRSSSWPNSWWVF